MYAFRADLSEIRHRAFVNRENRSRLFVEQYSATNGLLTFVHFTRWLPRRIIHIMLHTSRLSRTKMPRNFEPGRRWGRAWRHRARMQRDAHVLARGNRRKGAALSTFHSAGLADKPSKPCNGGKPFARRLRKGRALISPIRITGLVVSTSRRTPRVLGDEMGEGRSGGRPPSRPVDLGAPWRVYKLECMDCATSVTNLRRSRGIANPYRDRCVRKFENFRIVATRSRRECGGGDLAPW